MNKKRINICTSDIYRGDAIGNFSLQLLDFFNSQGFEVRLFARHFDAARTPKVMHFDLLLDSLQPDDVIFAQYSIFESGNALYHKLPNKKIAYYHGITPPEYFSVLDPQTERGCREGIRQASFFAGFDFYLANSQFMLDELFARMSHAGVENLEALPRAVMPPVLKIESRFEVEASEEDGSRLEDHRRYLLYVGRVAPHKKLEDLIEWFRCYMVLDKEVALVVVGSHTPPSYGECIRQLVMGDPALARRVVFKGHVTDKELCRLYRHAVGFITLSEHEGFCIPLVEAMGLSIPVFARRASAVPETLGRQDLMLGDQGFAAYAQEVFAVLTDPVLRDALVAKQYTVYREIVRRSSGDVLMSALDAVLERSIKENPLP